MTARSKKKLIKNPEQLAFAVATLIAVAIMGVFMIVTMPGRGHRGPLPTLAEKEKKLAADLRVHVEKLSEEIGQRSLVTPDALEEAASYIESELFGMGYQPGAHEYSVYKHTVRNIEVEIKGGARPDEILIIGAHYDTVPGTPGADDNASAVAGLLELARAFKGETPSVTIRFVFFVNEEPPFFKTGDMGSYRYAMRSKELGENIIGMLCLESIGYYSGEPESQQFPPPLGFFYPHTGDFIGFVGNIKSRKFLYSAIKAFRETTRFPSEGLAVPLPITGTDWSDHWAFWEAGYPAVMVTDTALFRNPNYHGPGDTAEKLDYESMARVVGGVGRIIETATR
jgi:hypothetical protein